MTTRDEAEIAVRFYGSVATAMTSGKVKKLVYSQLNDMLILSIKEMYKVNRGDRLCHPDNRHKRYIATSWYNLVNLTTGESIDAMDLDYPLEVYRYAHS